MYDGHAPTAAHPGVLKLERDKGGAGAARYPSQATFSDSHIAAFSQKDSSRWKVA